MITIACTNCKTMLTMDEAFAGGVCRCQHCGTIQTVPSHLKKGSTAGATAGRAVGASKSLYQQTRTPTDAASGLEALGDAVTSSGLGSARLKSPRVTSPTGKSIDGAPEAPPAKNPLLVPLLVAVGAVVVLGIIFAVYMLTRSSAPNGSGSGTSNGSADTGGAPGALPVVKGPSFMGVPIKGTNVIYLIDRANSSSDFFNGFSQVLLESLHSLGPDHTFKVMLWDNGDPPVSVPKDGMLNATSDNIQQVRNALENVVASSASTMSAQLNQAVALKPDAIVIVTGSKADLTGNDPSALDKASKAGIPLYLFEVGDDLKAPFQSAADASGGAYRSITSQQLDQASK